MEKLLKHALVVFQFLLNNRSLLELSVLEEADESFEKPKCGRFKIFDIPLMFFIKKLKETLNEC